MRTSGLKSLLSKFEDDEESSVEKDDSSNSQQISQEEADNFETKNDEPAKKKFKCDFCEKENLIFKDIMSQEIFKNVPFVD